MRMLNVGKNDANQRVDKFLYKTLPTLPKNLMYKYIRNKKIKLNGKRCDISTKVEENDAFTCYIAEEFFDIKRDDSFFEASSDLKIIYEDDNIILMNKEVGLITHSDDKVQIDTLVNRMKHYLYNKKEYLLEQEQSFSPSLCHRLDRNTQGIVIGAKSAQALRDMNECIHDGFIMKKYLCIVEGVLDSKEDILLAYHQKNNQEVFISKEYKEGYKEIKTGYRVIKEKSDLSLLEITLYTGKSHQIRAMMAHIHHPIYGDTKYGAKKRSYPYQALCAYEITFNTMVDNLAYLNTKTFKLEDIDFLKFMK